MQRNLKKIRNDKEKDCAYGDLNIQQNKCTTCKCFTCGSVDHLIDKCLKPPKYEKKRQNQVCFNERGNCSPQKESENGDNDNNQKIYAYMARMSVNDQSSGRDFGDSSQSTNCILDSGATCHMTQQV